MTASRAVPAAQAPVVVDRRGLRRLIGSANPLIVVVAVLGTELAYTSDDMLNLAIPSVVRDLDASAAGVQWVLAAQGLPSPAPARPQPPDQDWTGRPGRRRRAHVR